MSSAVILSRALDSDIAIVHQRFLRAMETRLPALNVQTKERYLAVLSTLVSKLEVPDKSLRDVLSEMMIEAASHLMEELSGSS